MGIISVLIFISLIIAIGFLIVFIWNLKSGQYDDTYSPSVRMLFDDKPKHMPRSDGSTEETIRDKTDGLQPEQGKPDRNRVYDLKS